MGAISAAHWISRHNNVEDYRVGGGGIKSGLARAVKALAAPGGVRLSMIA